MKAVQVTEYHEPPALVDVPDAADRASARALTDRDVGYRTAPALVALRSRKRSSHHGIVRPNDDSSTTEGPKQDLDPSLSY